MEGMMNINQFAVDMVLRDMDRRVAVHRPAPGELGRTVVVCHSAPGGGLFDPDPAHTRAYGVTLLAPDRPGYGRSDPLPAGAWASVGSAADDLAAVLDHSDQAPVGVVGWSAGGRVALALAARRPALVDRVVVVATPAPNDHVPWIPPEQQAGLDSLRGQMPDKVQSVLEQQFAPLTPPTVSAADTLPMVGASDADAALLAHGGARERLVGMLEAGFAQGPIGLVGDLAGYTLQPWGFEPKDVLAETLLLYGTRDPIAGPPHGAWWH